MGLISFYSFITHPYQLFKQSIIESTQKSFALFAHEKFIAKQMLTYQQQPPDDGCIGLVVATIYFIIPLYVKYVLLYFPYRRQNEYFLYCPFHHLCYYNEIHKR